MLAKSQKGIKDLDELLTHNEIFMARCQGIGNVQRPSRRSPTASAGRCCARPACRGTCARTSRTSIYDRFDFEIPVGNYGDVYDRYLVRLEEMRQSISIIEQALEQLPADGPIVPEKLPRRLRTPPGEVYCEGRSAARRVRRLPGLEGRRQAVPAEDALALVLQPVGAARDDASGSTWRTP